MELAHSIAREQASCYTVVGCKMTKIKAEENPSMSTAQATDFEDIVVQLGFRSPMDAARQQARMLLLGRMARYEAEMQLLSAKTHVTLAEMKQRYEATGTEDFEADDDYLEWRWLDEAVTSTRAQLAALSAD